MEMIIYDCAHYKKDCVKEATKKGWIIGNTKETKNIAVCPNCKEKYKLFRKVLKKIYNQLNKNLFDNVFTKETCDTYLKSKPVKAVVPVIENKVENVKTEEVKNEVIKENKIGDIKRIEIKQVPATK